ncbi:choice-of-anchor A domain-containing protein [Streptomyces albidoflavus]|uniref:choice-of-anchor A family protein n=1 Tax=Streptomyces albidoflavus TaxID=1886 RepID=UPI000775C0CC|nr:choice-of-anchor A family protein [Streptomyces albidoflavus]AMM09223.1 choice-of-anchor A domain-containing protein [Streptomyces albidoflavus]RZE80139.1 choice-of-anchor A family protein [Streptomyces albidoflavus]
MTPNRSSDQHSAPVRSRAVLTVALAVALAGGLAPAASAAPLPDGLGPCLGAGCPGTWDDPGNKPVTGHDSNINVYVGGNYLVREAAAEAEGRIVTLGNFDMDKRDGASPAYRVGVTDGGSDHLAVGANLTVAPGQRLLAEEGTGSGVVRYGGSLDGTVIPATVNSPDDAAPYADLRGDLTDAGRCYAYTGDARRAVTGQALRDGSSTTFEGDGAAPLQIFSVDADLVSGTGGGPTDISFTGIPDGATVLVNVYGDTRTLDSDAVTLPDPDQRRRLLWNFPDATALTLTGAAELEGSVLVGQPASVTTLSLAAVNGRLYTAGSLTHTSAGESGGQRLRASPFDGELPDCSASSRRAAVQAVAPRSAPEPHPSLPDTGARGGAWLLSGIAAALLAAGTTLVVTARRARRRY